MDFTVPYTFYPMALPHWMSWILFLLAMLGGTVAGVVKGRGRGWVTGLCAAMIGALGFLAVTMVASMVVAFFVHDL